MEQTSLGWKVSINLHSLQTSEHTAPCREQGAQGAEMRSAGCCQDSQPPESTAGSPGSKQELFKEPELGQC